MKITEDVYALDSTKGAYVYLIKNKEICLVDTCFPGKGKAILSELKSLGVRPEDVKHILITHYDIDHIGSVDFLQRATGAKVWAPEEDIPYITGELIRPGFKKFVASIAKVKIPEKLQAYGKDRKIGDIRVIPAPGHTPGHVCLLYHEVLLAGDLVNTRKGHIQLPAAFMNWDRDILAESFRKVASLSFRWVCPAHGKPVERDSLEG